MTLRTDCKDTITETLRQRIGKQIPKARETDRAEFSLCTLSFQSSVYPERHVWIDTDDGEIKIDLEDWQDESEWDNAFARVTVESVNDAVELVQTWLSGSNLDRYSNLNKAYEMVRKVVTTNSTLI
jgi:hypothetical protein